VDVGEAAARWVEGYRTAWLADDVEAVVALYADDVVYRSHPFRPPEVGREGVRGYTQRNFDIEEDQQVRFGRPITSGDRAAVEYWTTMREEDRDVTLAGCVLLRFGEDGRVKEQREYWHLQEGHEDPPEGWGR
jgi:ketosteroid isomerase-like protein